MWALRGSGGCRFGALVKTITKELSTPQTAYKTSFQMPLSQFRCIEKCLAFFFIAVSIEIDIKSCSEYILSGVLVR